MTDISKAISALSPEKRALLALKLREQGNQFNTFPLSFAQRRLWFLDQLTPESPVYNIPIAVRLTGRVDIRILEQCLNEIVRRHEILRTTFTTSLAVDGEPVQVVKKHAPVKLGLVDLRELSAHEREAKVSQWIADESQRPFDLTNGPLLRITIYRLDEQEHVLLLVIHHIISDGWSTGVLIREVATLYRFFLEGKPSPLDELPIQYADFASWQREWLQDGKLEPLLDYWKRQLEGCPPALELPTDRARPALQSYRGAQQSVVLTKKLSAAIKALGQREKATPFMVLLAALQTLLHRYTIQEDICVGTLVAGRNRGEAEGLIGFFVNTLVIRTDLSGDPSFRELLRRVREQSVGAYAHQDLPFEMLVEKLQPERNLSHTPFFQVAFAYQNGLMEALELPGLTLHRIELDHQTTKFDLMVTVTEGAEDLCVLAEYNTDLFNDDTIARLLRHYQSLLEGIITDPDQRISDLPLLTEAERKLILSEWNDTGREYPRNKCIFELFESQAERNPEAIALVFESERLTYKELNKRANQLAHHLRKLGVGPEVLVGICLERSVEMVVALLATLKAGGAYVPLDPAYPKERLEFILEDTQAQVLLTQERLVEGLGIADCGLRIADLKSEIPRSILNPQSAIRNPMVVCLDTGWGAIAEENDENPVSGVRADNLAYVIYTSGSTGRPKGVAIEHRNAGALIHWAREVFTQEELAGVLASTSICFDLSVFELFVTLSWGGKIVLTENVLQLSGLPAADEVTLVNTVPSVMAELVRMRGVPASVCTINLAGEPLQTRLVKEIYQQETIKQVFDLYGPSEDTTYSTFALRSATGRATIGRPIANTQIYLLDYNLRPVPVGVTGEVYIGGDGLARCYLKRPDLTAEKWIPNPFGNQPGARLYKTGDLARYLPDGNIEFLGRIDHQVKIRGFRIELAEIEAVLTQHPAVREAAVLAREYITGDKGLVGYVVFDPDNKPSIGELKSYLQQKLPEYMVPPIFVVLDALPLTPNRKVDRRALPLPERKSPDLAGAYVAPRTHIEEMLVGIWAEVLGDTQVGIHDSFFDLGGHSLLATRVISRVREAYQVDLPLRHLFEALTVAGLAERIETAMRAEPGLSAPPIKPVSRDGNLPLSFAQQRLWFIDQMEPGNPSYNMPIAVRLTGALNVVALEASLNEIVRRHESLRTTFSALNGQPQQVIAAAQSLALPVLDLSTQSEAESREQVRKLATEEALRPFDLAQGPLLRVQLLRLGAEEHVVLFTMHHIISDEWSLGVLVRELAALYEAYCQGRPSPLAELGIQYSDFAHWQREWLQGEALERQLGYWRQQLGDGLPVLKLPFDHPRPAQQSYRGATHTFVISPEVSASLKGLSRQEGVTMFMTLLAGLQTLLHRYSGQEEIVVGTDVANRNRLETEGLIGFFINHLVIRTKLGGNPTFRQLLRRVREVTLGAYAHQDLPFDKLVGALQLERNLGQTQLFQVLFVFGNPTMPTLELPGLTLSPLRSELVMSKYDLTLFMNERDKEIGGAWRYSTELFDAATITRISDHFETILSSIVANPDTRPSSLEMLAEAEREQRDREKLERQEIRNKKLRGVSRKAVDLS